MKLTSAQIQFLRDAQSNGAANANPRNRTTRKLSDLGLIEESFKGISNVTWIITDAGRAALAVIE